MLLEPKELRKVVAEVKQGIPTFRHKPKYKPVVNNDESQWALEQERMAYDKLKS